MSYIKPSNDHLESALSYAARGWSVVPMHTPTENGCSCGKGTECPSPGKHPRTEHGVKDGTTDPNTIKESWERWPQANIGIVTGVTSGLLVLDVDPRHEGDESLLDLESQHGKLPDTVESLTGGGGRHIFFAHPGRPIKNRIGLAPGLDVKADGGYVIAPPSLHVSGRRYEWEISSDPADVPLAPCPDWLLEMLKDQSLTDPGKPLGQMDPSEVLAGVPEGQRDVRIFQYACRLRAMGMGRQEAEILVLTAAGNCTPSFPKKEALRKVENAWRYAAGHADQVAKRLEPPKGFTAAELMGKEFTDPKWAVPSILPEGLTILAGKPKVGKSWFALGLAVAIAQGDRALGAIEVEQGEVLYLALEDSERRLQRRLTVVLQGVPPPDNLHLYTHWLKVDAGGLDHLKGTLDKHPDTRLVIIDTLAKVRPGTKKSGDLYLQDYEALGGLKGIADEYGVSVVVIHHLRKGGADDPLDQVSGTTGLTGAADTVQVLERSKRKGQAVLKTRGRDVEESELQVRFDPDTCSWLLYEDPRKANLTPERQEILDELGRSSEPVGPKHIADRLGKNESTVRWHLTELAAQGLAKRPSRGLYTTTTNNTNKQTIPTDQQTNVGVVGDGFESTNNHKAAPDIGSDHFVGVVGVVGDVGGEVGNLPSGSLEVLPTSPGISSGAPAG